LQSEADVVCLQEVDKMPELMQKLNHIYKGFCAMKPDGMMGCAILWKEDKLR